MVRKVFIEALLFQKKRKQEKEQEIVEEYKCHETLI